MKNRICLWLSTIAFALSLFGCSIDVRGDDNSKPKDSTELTSGKDDNSKPKDSTALTSVKVNGIAARVNQDGKTWVCTVYGNGVDYDISSIEAIPADKDATVKYKTTTGVLTLGKTFNTDIFVSKGEESTTHRITVVYAKDFVLSRVTVDGNLSTLNEEGTVWTCEVFGVTSEYTINSIEAIPVYNAMDVKVEKTSGKIKFGETFTTKITVASEKSTVKYTLNVIYSKDLSLSSVSVNGNAAKPNEDGTVWTYNVYGTATAYEITSVVAIPSDNSATINYDKTSGQIGFNETFTSKIAYTNGTEKRDFTLNVTYSKEITPIYDDKGNIINSYPIWVEYSITCEMDQIASAPVWMKYLTGTDKNIPIYSKD
jgi:hypothetical protein